MSVKLLLDENLSPSAAVVLAAGGIDACHVRDRGLLGAFDHDVLERAYQEDRVLVTLNVDDFAKLVRAREIHAGVVLIERAGLLRDEQVELIRKVVAKLVEHGAVTSAYAKSKGVPQGSFIDRDWNFDMYGTVDKSQTFHKEHLDSNTHGNTATSMAVRTDK